MAVRANPVFSSWTVAGPYANDLYSFRTGFATRWTISPNRITTASEPGSPPVGPSGGRSGSIFSDEPEPPDGGPPEPGVPDPPAGPHPGGPDASRFGTVVDNPWILYWFISLKTPMFLDVIDLHITRRLEALQR